MKKFSNTYIFLYVGALVTVIALLLSLAAVGLKPRHEANRQREKAVQILKAAGYDAADKADAVRLLGEVASPKANAAGREMYGIHCSDGTDGVVVYVDGKGLWGPIWGYVIMDEDMSEIKGVTFSHKSETPGLGANIAEPEFEQRFAGKKLRDGNGNFKPLQVLKGGGHSDDPHGVDAVSGATITSRGVENMLSQSLKEVVQ